jgi:NDP-sugar pyrophosphorylase family protein
MSSYFPYGIPLGTITQLENDINSGFYMMTAELFENPSEVYAAYVIENKFKEEIDFLNKEVKP